MLERRENWWSRPCGGRELLILALPLVISTSFTSVMHFTDRLFLTWYSMDAMAASMQAGIVQWTLICFAFGVASYVNTFVAQYHGAGHDERVGLAVWQGIWFGILLTPLFLLSIPLAPWIFDLAGHEENIRREEITYFQILAWGSGATVIQTAMSAFYTGRGQTWVTMAVSFVACAVNVVLDYLFIFDYVPLGIPGIAGAAWATVIAQWSAVVAYGIWMYSSPAVVKKYGLLTGWRLNGELMRRLVYFGGSSGAQMVIEASGFTLLVTIVGRLGAVESAATTLAFNSNIVAFIPMVGLGIAVSTLVGQQLGNNRPDNAARATWNGLALALGYASVFATLYLIVPQIFFAAHSAGAHGEDFVQSRAMAEILLRFVALYFLFDAAQIIFVCALKGAGDTWYVLLVAGTVSILSVTIGQLGTPTFAPLVGGGIYWWWYVITGWIFTLAVLYLARFLQGGWRTKRVIEEEFTLPAGVSLPNDLSSDAV
ncbi:MAG TPA: MATE family efflux transporter [Pirellulaceae bacterium]|nr:MATE family efflux transporter [Pirellulaceae bacterium]